MCPIRRPAINSQSTRNQLAINSHSVLAFRSVSIRGPRLTQQGHDFAVVILPCVVEGSVAVLVSERRIRASFEETLDDREAAVDCRAMKS